MSINCKRCKHHEDKLKIKDGTYEEKPEERHRCQTCALLNNPEINYEPKEDIKTEFEEKKQ